MQNTISELLKDTENKFTNAAIEDPAANAEFLLAHIIGVRRTWLAANADYNLTEEELAKYTDVVNKKLTGVPMAYIIGSADFCGHSFIVDEDVLIPRPETEELVQFSMDMLPAKPRRLLDMCTGSGAIVCTLAMKYRNTEVVGVDNSMPALLTAKKNIEKFDLPVQLIYGDLFENVDGAFDAIITNPPYIPSADLPGLSPEVQREPASALDGGETGLDIITQIILYSPDYLTPGGLLAIEHCKGQEEDIKKIFDMNVWQSVASRKDMYGINRFIFAIKK
ncbi:release factor glutamine methyltransferase [Elusimicrobium simillimum]|uniref:peptide chain release factor N(5)-glutamine methyltransferase n=1 Tax=Elusimicrobium simillimum TaxID=3143438 RepID=UPI003C6ED08A